MYTYATGAAADSVQTEDVTAYIYVDDDNTSLYTEVTTQTFVNIGNGYYRLKITDSLSCNAGVVYFVIATSGIVADPIYFTTQLETPTVAIDTTAANLLVSNIITNEKATTYDGITQEKIYEMLLAFMSNKVTVSVTATDTKVISYKNRDGDTEVFSITVKTTDGSRSSSGTIN
jgi:hypothetical protein